MKVCPFFYTLVLEKDTIGGLVKRLFRALPLHRVASDPAALIAAPQSCIIPFCAPSRDGTWMRCTATNLQEAWIMEEGRCLRVWTRAQLCHSCRLFVTGHTWAGTHAKGNWSCNCVLHVYHLMTSAYDARKCHRRCTAVAKMAPTYANPLGITTRSTPACLQRHWRARVLYCGRL